MKGLQLAIFLNNLLVNKMSETSDKFASQFPKDKSDIFKLSETHVKTHHHV